jgi:Ion channel
VLLILLIVTYLLSAFLRSSSTSVAQLALFVLTGRLALRASRLPGRRARALMLVAVAGSLAAAGLALARPSNGAVAAASLWTGLLLLGTVTLIVVRIVAFPEVTAQSIYGAISAYLLIGLMFAAFYAAISEGHGGHFFAHGQPGNSQTFQYFSFTTLTTLGYGDFTAAGSDGRAIAVMEALTGQVFLATLVARLVAAFRGPGGRGSQGPPPAAGGADGPGGAAGGGGNGGGSGGGSGESFDAAMPVRDIGVPRGRRGCLGAGRRPAAGGPRLGPVGGAQPRPGRSGRGRCRRPAARGGLTGPLGAGQVAARICVAWDQATCQVPPRSR